MSAWVEDKPRDDEHGLPYHLWRTQYGQKIALRPDLLAALASVGRVFPEARVTRYRDNHTGEWVPVS